LTISADVDSGYALGPHNVLECTGYSYDPAGDPWTQCVDRKGLVTLDFGTLSSRLKDSGGNDAGGAGCFYGEKFFIVYLYPDAWGGAGYDLTQTAATSLPVQIRNAVVMTPVYSEFDKYDPAKPGQGILNDPALGITGEVLGDPVLAYNGGRILMARRPRIVRAQYSIPPYPATGDPDPVDDPAWEPVQLTTPEGSYSTAAGGVLISITPI
jgi:hypothetical protein